MLLLSSFERASTPGRHKQDWGRGFIFLLTQAPGSDAGSDGINPETSFVIQNR